MTTGIAQQVELADLLLDVSNPRLPATEGQDQALKLMLQSFRRQVMELCRDIATFGLSPVESMIALRQGDSLVALDGNRRLTALKILANPSLADGLLTAAQRRALSLMSDVMPPMPDGIRCVVFESREEADLWIRRLHEGERGGAGRVAWNSVMKHRYDEMMGLKKDPSLQVLDFVIEAGGLSDAEKARAQSIAFPLSTLQRVINDPNVREAIGVSLERGVVTTVYPASEVLKPLIKLVGVIGSGTVQVGSLMTARDRDEYIGTFSSEELPSPTARGSRPVPLSEAPRAFVAVDEPAAEPSPKPATTRSERPSAASRSHLIPETARLSITAPRANDIYRELKFELRMKKAPNAVAVLLRVFIELSVDHYIRTFGLSGMSGTLEAKVQVVCSHLRETTDINKHDLLAIREAAKNISNANLAMNLNAFVHSETFVPAAADLAALWDRTSPFLTILWDVASKGLDHEIGQPES